MISVCFHILLPLWVALSVFIGGAALSATDPLRVDIGFCVESGICIYSGEDDPSGTHSIGDRYYKTNGTAYIYTASGWSSISYGGGASYTHYFMKDEGNPYAKVAQTVYTAIGRFYYAGSVATPIQKIVVTAEKKSTGNGYIKIYDFTNANTIAESEFSNTNIDIIDLGTISNLPSAAAILEIQAKRVEGDEAWIYSLDMR